MSELRSNSEPQTPNPVPLPPKGKPNSLCLVCSIQENLKTSPGDSSKQKKEQLQTLSLQKILSLVNAGVPRVTFQVIHCQQKVIGQQEKHCPVLTDCHIKCQQHSIFLNVENISSIFLGGSGQGITIFLRQILMEVLKVV